MIWPEVGLLETQLRIANKFFQKFLFQVLTSHGTTQLQPFPVTSLHPAAAVERRVWTGSLGFWYSLSGVKTKGIIVFFGTGLHVCV